MTATEAGFRKTSRSKSVSIIFYQDCISVKSTVFQSIVVFLGAHHYDEKGSNFKRLSKRPRML